jgi:hypothetical protein
MEAVVGGLPHCVHGEVSKDNAPETQKEESPRTNQFGSMLNAPQLRSARDNRVAAKLLSRPKSGSMLSTS